MKPKPIDAWQPSPRVTIRRGQLVRLVGNGGDVPYRLRGQFRVTDILQARGRVWLEVCGLTATGGTYTVYVAGRPYKRHGLRWRPYKVKRA